MLEANLLVASNIGSKSPGWKQTLRLGPDPGHKCGVRPDPAAGEQKEEGGAPMQAQHFRARGGVRGVGGGQLRLARGESVIK